MVVADLHVHTTHSDGTLTLEAIPAVARAAGLAAVAVTDHDRFHPDLAAPLTQVDGITLIHGIELRVQAEGVRVDLLGYGLRRTPALRTLVEDLQENRLDRARQIVDCLEEYLGVHLDVEIEPGVGRPHVARAVEASSAPYDYQDAFDELIGNDCPCYVSRDIPSFAKGREILTAACGLVGIAHPLRYSNPERALELAPELDAIEVYYPYGHDVSLGRVRRLAVEHDLVVTGGSDAHGRELALAGLGRDDYEQFRACIE